MKQPNFRQRRGQIEHVILQSEKQPPDRKIVQPLAHHVQEMQTNIRLLLGHVPKYIASAGHICEGKS